MFAHLKLGAHPPIFPASRPMLTSQRMMARQAPPKLIRDHVDPGAQMDANDSLGICTAAGMANAARAQAAIANYKLAIPTARTIAFYSQSTGYVPGNAATDEGGVEVDVLTNAARDGFDIGEQTRLFPVWGSIDHGDLNGMCMVATVIGPVYAGFALALADQAGGVWDTGTPASQGDPTPGSWGYHCALPFWSYTGMESTDVVEILTWGMRQKATVRWVLSRITEAHGLGYRQLIKANALGLDWGAWQADCAAYLQSA